MSSFNCSIHGKQVCLFCNSSNGSICFLKHYRLTFNLFNTFIYCHLFLSTRCGIRLKYFKRTSHFFNRRAYRTNISNHLFNSLCYTTCLIFNHAFKRLNIRSNFSNCSCCSLNTCIFLCNSHLNTFNVSKDLCNRTFCIFYSCSKIRIYSIEVNFRFLELNNDVLDFFNKFVKSIYYSTNFIIVCYFNTTAQVSVTLCNTFNSSNYYT